MPSKNRPANGKGASAYGSHKNKGRRVRGWKRRMKRATQDRKALAFPYLTKVQLRQD